MALESFRGKGVYNLCFSHHPFSKKEILAISLSLFLQKNFLLGKEQLSNWVVGKLRLQKGFWNTTWLHQHRIIWWDGGWLRLHD